jgi:transketolase
VKNSILYLKDLSRQVRRDILRMIYNASSGHPGGSLGAVEFFVALYNEIMSYSSSHFSPTGYKEDVFFLSNGHICPVYYSVLARSGFFNVSELGTYRKINSRLQGHPTNSEGLPGIRISSGSLGQGMSVAIGCALSKLLNKDDKLVYSLHGDGELNEGQVWEAILYAGAKNIDNYIAVIDFNGQQIDGPTNTVLNLGSLRDKFESFGWCVIEEFEGNDINKVINVLEYAKTKTKNKYPVVIILYTEMGCGVDFMEGSHIWHGKSLNKDELERALLQLPQVAYIGDY